MTQQENVVTLHLTSLINCLCIFTLEKPSFQKTNNPYIYNHYTLTIPFYVLYIHGDTTIEEVKQCTKKGNKRFVLHMRHRPFHRPSLIKIKKEVQFLFWISYKEIPKYFHYTILSMHNQGKGSI